MSSGDLAIKMSGDAKSVLQQQAKVIAQQDEAIKKYKQMERASRRQGRQNERTIRSQQKSIDSLSNRLKTSGNVGQSAFGRIRVSALAAGTAMAAAAFAAKQTLDAMRDVSEESKRLGESQREAAPNLAILTQVAKSRKDLGLLIRTAEDVFARGGTNTLGEAAELVFNLRSSGRLNQRQAKFFTELGATGTVANTGEFLAKIDQLQSTFGRGATGDSRATASRAFGASGFSLRSAEEILTGAGRTGVSGKAIGMSPDEALAAVAFAATAKGSGDLGGTIVNSLFKALGKQGGFEGKGLIASLEQVDSMKLSPAQLMQFFGRQEAAEAFGILNQRRKSGELQKAIAATRGAPGRDAVGAAMRRTASQPQLAAARARRMALNRSQIQQRRRAASNTAADALMEDMATRDRAAGASETFIALRRRLVLEPMRFFRGDNFFLRGYRGGASGSIRPLLRSAGGGGGGGGINSLPVGQVAQQQVKAADEQKRAAEKLERAANQLQRAAGKMAGFEGNGNVPPRFLRQQANRNGANEGE